MRGFCGRGEPARVTGKSGGSVAAPEVSWPKIKGVQNQAAARKQMKQMHAESRHARSWESLPEAVRAYIDNFGASAVAGDRR